MTEPKRIALFLGRDFQYGGDVLQGICAYARPGKPWVFLPGTSNPPDVGRVVASMRLDGAIGMLSDPTSVAVLKAAGVVAVNVSHLLPQADLPRVGLLDEEVGALAAKHYLERSYRDFAFVGHPGHGYSDDRERGFDAAVKAAGFEVRSLRREYPVLRHFTDRDAEIGTWLRELARPVGLLACNDHMAWQVAERCQMDGLRVPEDVAILGVDNDDLYCRLAPTPLSSVDVPARRIGYEAASLLERLMAGKKAPRRPLLLPPVGVVTRQSTDVIAVDDREVASAVRFIRDHADEPIGVEDVVVSVALSRRALERRFREALGRSPLQEIRRVHIERAKALLAATDEPLPEIARRSGFGSYVRLAVVFRQETGKTPRGYRRQFRLGA